MFPRRGSARLFVATAVFAVLAGCSAQASPAPDVAAVPAAQAQDAATAGSLPSDAATAPNPAAPNPAAANPAAPNSAAAAATNQQAGTPAPPVPTAPSRAGLPADVPAPPAATGQLVTVAVTSPTATTATLRAWERQPGGGWRATIAPLKVRVGTDGVGRASESSRRTPAGSYPLDQAFGRQPDPGTKLPYRHVGNSDWWVSDTHSPAYNTYRHCAIGTCPFDESAGENLGQAGASYDYALVIGYNTAKPVAGAGSAFFLHVDAGVASAGCVEVPRATVVSLLRWLDPGRHPRIDIAVG